MENRTVKEASVEGVQRRRTPKKHFVFCVRVTWSDGTVNLVYRSYSEFLHLQTILCQAFPDLLGKPRSNRKNFNQLPESCRNIGETLFNRVEQLNLFLKDIFGFEKVTQSKIMKSFLRPKGEDVDRQQQLPRRKKKKRISNGSFSKTMKKRLNFRKSSRIVGNNISSPIVLDRFIVMDDYKKQAKSDLNLKKGKVVEVIEKRESGWWLVDADGEVGWAPALHLEPADEMSEVDVSNVRKFPIGQGEVYVSTKRYVAVEDDELSFEIGVNLQILEKNFDGWWKASYLGREGWVPQMYLKKLGEDRRRLRAVRKSVYVRPTVELRDCIEEEDGMIVEISNAKVDSKIHKKGNKPSQEGDDVKDGDQKKPGSDGKSKTVGVMFDLSSMLLPVQIPQEGSSAESPNPQTLEASADGKLSERPSLQHRSVSDGIALVLGKTREDHEEIKKGKDDMELKKSRSLESTLSSKGIDALSDGVYNSTAEPKWTPEAALRKSGRDETPKLNSRAMNEEIAPAGGKHECLKEELKLRDSMDQNMGVNIASGHNPTVELSIHDSVKKDAHGKTPPVRQARSAYPRSHSPPKSDLDQRLVHQVSLKGEVNQERDQEIENRSPTDESDLKLQGLNQCSTESYNFKEPRKVSENMFLAKGENVKVIERGSHGRWMVVDEHGTTAPTSSAKLYPATGTNGYLETFVPGTEETSGKQADDNKDYEEREKEMKDSIMQMVYRAASSFEGTEENQEIDFQEGEILEIVHKDGSGWWCARNSEGEIGWVPSNFLKLSQGEADSDEDNDDDDDDDDDDDEGEKEEEENENWEEDNEDDVFVEEHKDEAIEPKISCHVISDFKGNENNQEINLQKGEILQILHKEESGWWCVRNENGEIGWAPQIHLEALEDHSD